MDPDIWLHMAFGRFVLEHGRLPPGDIYSFTSAGHSWTSSGWLPSLIFELLYRAGGAKALVYSVFAVISAAYVLTYFAALYKFGNPRSAFFILLLALQASTLRFTPRPEVFSQFFLVCVLLVLLASIGGNVQRVPRYLWLLPLLFILWANSHAGFLAGLAPVGLAAISCLYQWKKHGNRANLISALLCLSCFVSWILNPYGFQIALLSQKIKSLPGVDKIVFEWQPLFGEHGMNLPLAAVVSLALLVACTVYVLWKDRNRVFAWETATVLLFAALPLFEIRHAALASLAMAVIFIRHSHILEGVFSRPYVLVSAGTAALLCLCAIQFRGLNDFGSGWPKADLDDSLLPYTATAYLKRNPPPAQLWNSYGPGGYLLYHLGPRTKVFMDGRNDVYEPKVWKDYWAIQDGLLSLEDANRLYGVNTFFIYAPQNNDNPNNLANRLTAAPNWKLTYFDDSYAIYVRQTPDTAAYLNSRAFRFLSPFALERLQQALQNPGTRDEAQNEIKRELEQSAGSARAHLMASFAARQLGNITVAQQEQEAAAARNPWASIMPSPANQR
jgi:hypothetical protein